MKRKRSQQSCDKARKIFKIDGRDDVSTTTNGSLLRLYYPRVQSLRDYLLSQLPHASKRRRKLLVAVPIASGVPEGEQQAYTALRTLLDYTIVGSFDREPYVDSAKRQEEQNLFSQQVSESTGGTANIKAHTSMSEIADFAIWKLFRRHQAAVRPPHILCHGLLRSGACENNVPGRSDSTIPGLVCYSANPYIEQIKSRPWTDLPALLGKIGDVILSDLLVDCAIFAPLVTEVGSLYQLSGTPLNDLKPLSSLSKSDQLAEGEVGKIGEPKLKGLNAIKFVRHRMFYGRPIHNARGSVTFGHRPVHILNRKKNCDSHSQTLHVMMYIFPRQFGLHNVFTSAVDPKKCAQPFKDYTTREQEIHRLAPASKTTSGQSDHFDSERRFHVPKRLRGRPVLLVEAIRKRHSKCAYTALAQYHCSPCKERRMQDAGEPVQTRNTCTSEDRISGLATPSSTVSVFCRSVLNKVFPSELWGHGEAGEQNKRVVMRSIDQFVQLGRYEAMTLHSIMQSLKISAMRWLDHPKQTQGTKLSATDLVKRTEIVAELIYYIFDSFLMPLISSTFYVTETSVHRNQLLYFRHDVWQRLAQPALASLGLTIFEELSSSAVKRRSARRALGTSRVRLLPKETGLRPIINLQRRVLSKVNGRSVLGVSVNSVVKPAFNVLNYEKSVQSDALGSSLFSAADMFPRLECYKERIEKMGLFGKPLYFAKVDVRSCFDTIPQQPLLRMLQGLFTAKEYSIGRYAEARLLGGAGQERELSAKATWKYIGRAQPLGQDSTLSQILQKDRNGSNANSIFVDAVVRNYESTTKIMDLLEEHVEQNIVQIGKKYYRQKEGIPQGSIVSSLLCSFFYAQLEQEKLSFVRKGESLLLRLIDDFLLISTSEETAKRFVQVMHAGLPEYGVTIKLAKSMVNFDIDIDGQAIRRVPECSDFAYCGNTINTVNLNIRKDLTRSVNRVGSVTVEHSIVPGQSFYRKTLNMLKLHMHTMLLSTAFNEIETVLGNLYHAFKDTAEKCLQYMSSLSAGKQPGDRLVIRTVDDLMQLAFALTQRRQKRSISQNMPSKCPVTKAQTRWLASKAFLAVFQKRQSKHRVLIAHLQLQLSDAGVACWQSRFMLDDITRQHR